ncbi:MAG: PadR family transcriptional regulator [Clostridia bacterium]|nr:PadR family transcriptional regulator [Clostridia bacterium]MBR5991205.1 PadR family transcriptional regulator [Clostridia bacterium]MBR6479034.1 PadR family transcriptional regulator [Clostridia bacterium]
MRNLKYAILGLVNREPMTGYDIKKAFEDRALTSFWHAEHSQIYPELKRLVDEGMLNFDTDIRGEKMEKKLYTITPAGRNEFLEWLKDDVPVERTYKDIFRLRTFYSESLTDEEFLTLLKSQLKQHKEKRDHLAEIRRSVFLDTPPEKGTRELGDYMVLDGAVLREESYVAWLEHCIKIFR